MTYMMWQINDMKSPLPQSIQQALDHHRKKYGQVPNLIEHGMKIEMPNLPGIQYRPINIPANILLITNE